MAKAPKIIKFPKQGIRLRAARAVAGFEHAVDLADKLGILQNTYTTYERGEREFPTEHLAALIEHTGFPAAHATSARLPIGFHPRLREPISEMLGMSETDRPGQPVAPPVRPPRTDPPGREIKDVPTYRPPPPRPSPQ